MSGIMSEEITFADLDLSPEVMDSLKKMGVKRPTTIQQKAIPLMMDNISVIAKAPTGTGKTFAFGIPILEYLNMDSKFIQALILCPTRELALQITTELKGLAKYIKGFRVTSLIGGQSMRLQTERIQKNPQVVVATPGRLIDMVGRRLVDISQIYTLVLDEADEMLKMGFINDIRKVMALTPKDKQIALFSATMPREIQNITWEFMQDAAEIDVMPKAEDHPDIDQFIVECPEKDKLQAIIRIMAKEDLRKTIVFCNTKSTTSKVGEMLTHAGVSAKVLHGDIGQGTRNKVMDQYRADKFDVLVATDVTIFRRRMNSIFTGSDVPRVQASQERLSRSSHILTVPGWKR